MTKVVECQGKAVTKAVEGQGKAGLHRCKGSGMSRKGSDKRHRCVKPACVPDITPQTRGQRLPEEDRKERP